MIFTDVLRSFRSTSLHSKNFIIVLQEQKYSTFRLRFSGKSNFNLLTLWKTFLCYLHAISRNITKFEHSKLVTPKSNLSKPMIISSIRLVSPCWIDLICYPDKFNLQNQFLNWTQNKSGLWNSNFLRYEQNISTEKAFIFRQVRCIFLQFLFKIKPEY